MTNPEITILCPEGPIAEPQDARYFLDRTEGVHCVQGANSMERLPVIKAIVDTTRAFKKLDMSP